MLERSGVSLMASNQISAQTRVQVLLEYVGEKELDCGEVAELKKVRLLQIIQLVELQNDAKQVMLPYVYVVFYAETGKFLF